MQLIVHGKVVRAATGGRPLDPERPLVVFLHAAGGNRTFWSLQTRHLAARARAVLAVDLPGHGGSDGPALDSVEKLADWTIEVIAATGWSEAALVGHSLGALASLQAAADAPGTVSHLALIAGAGAMPVNPVLLEVSRDEPRRAWALVMEWGLSSPSGLGGGSTPGPWTEIAGSKILATGPAAALHTDLVAADRYDGGTDAASKVACPTLLIHGDEDRMVRVDAARGLAAMISGSRIVVLPGVGHFPTLEDPDAVLDALGGLLR